MPRRICPSRQQLVGVQGFEPRKCLSQSQVPYRLATPQYTAVGAFLRKKRKETSAVRANITALTIVIFPRRACEKKKRQLVFGWDSRIRTGGMTESKSVALAAWLYPITENRQTT